MQLPSIPTPAKLAAGAVLLAVAFSSGWTVKGWQADSERLESVQRAIQQAQQQYESAIAWGNQVSAQLAARQTEIRTMRNQHADYALSIDGTCPGRLRYLHDAAALGATLPDAARASLAAAQPLDAARIAGAIADNYARARECQAQLNALIAWHEGPQ